MMSRWLPWVGVWMLIIILAGGPAAATADNRIHTNTVIKPTLDVAKDARLIRVASAGLPPGRVGRPYRYQVKSDKTQRNPAYRIVAGQLPKGLKVDTRGLIQGIPAAPGRFKFTLQASSRGATAASRVTQDFILNIAPRILKPSVKSRPESVTVAAQRPTAITLTHYFSSGENGLTLYSSEGRFMAGRKQLAKVARPLTITLKQASGQSAESLTVPPEMIKAAKQSGADQVLYIRAFRSKDQMITLETVTRIIIAHQPTLRLEGLRLNFQKKALPNRLQRVGSAQAVLTTNQPPPPLHAHVLLNQPGSFNAYWQVDGKVLSRPMVYKTKEKQMAVPFPYQHALLKKLTPGKHRIQFIVTQPKMQQPAPQAVLVVEKEKTPVRTKPVMIKAVAPKPDSHLDYQAFSFQWTGIAAVAVYKIEFSTSGHIKPFFSAYANERIYPLKSDIIKRHFSPGKAYVWQVKGLNADKQVVSQSPVLPFVFKPPPDVMAGQVVVITASGPGGGVTLNRISKKYQLKVIESTAIRTLKRTATVLGTSGDVSALVRQLRREHGILQVQPNRLFRTMAEPQNDLQEIVATLNLPAVHQHYQGKGITVAIVDTGVDTHHPDLKQRVVRHANLIRNNPYRAEIHGTALAGVMAASINNYGITGIAPQAELMALRACWQTTPEDPEGTCTTLSIAKAIDMAIASKALIVNMSFGAPTPDRLMMQLLDAGAQAGVLFVAPVGNSKDRKKMPFPASHSKVLSVGGWDQGHQPYPNAELAKAADVCAPAGSIFTTTPGKRHNFLSGTSISAAIVSGILAVAKEKNRFLGMSTLPEFEDDICGWQEQLIHRPVCQ